jgi:uncharacterized protein
MSSPEISISRDTTESLSAGPSVATASIVWHRTDLPGHEFCSLAERNDGARLAGTVVLSNGTTPCSVDYEIRCDAKWRTESCQLFAQIGRRVTELFVRRDGDVWTVNDEEDMRLVGCEDIDLGFSPSTNLLPIRRLALAVGARASVRAAWIKFPELTLQMLEQTYMRLREDTYRYESAGGTFRRDLKVDARGFVLEYPDLWYAESHT